LKKQGKKVYLLSNAQRIFTEYEMHVLQIAQYFDGILISSDYQTKKPDRRFFDILIDRYDLDVKKSLFIGNDSNTDIAGAGKVGMDTFYVKSNISPAQDMADADFVVAQFTEWN
jgi:putative hydrolase of the HAD superfamily